MRYCGKQEENKTVAQTVNGKNSGVIDIKRKSLISSGKMKETICTFKLFTFHYLKCTSPL